MNWQVASLYIRPEDHVLGIDLDHIKARLEDPDLRPITVAPDGRILNGRHRYIAALIRGDEYVTVEIWTPHG